MFILIALKYNKHQMLSFNLNYPSFLRITAVSFHHILKILANGIKNPSAHQHSPNIFWNYCFLVATKQLPSDYKTIAVVVVDLVEDVKFYIDYIVQLLVILMVLSFGKFIFRKGLKFEIRLFSRLIHLNLGASRYDSISMSLIQFPSTLLNVYLGWGAEGQST